MGNCQHAGCTNPATHIHDRSIQLPDYVNLCAAHHAEYSRKQSIEFDLNCLQIAMTSLERDTAAQLKQMRSYLDGVRKLTT